MRPVSSACELIIARCSHNPQSCFICGNTGLVAAFFRESEVRLAVGAKHGVKRAISHGQCDNRQRIVCGYAQWEEAAFLFHCLKNHRNYLLPPPTFI